jgi:AraC-like DNA-binding protein
MFYIYFNEEANIKTPLPFSYLAGITLANLSIQIFINPYILFGFDNIRFYSNDSFIAKKYKNDINTNQLFNETWKNELEEKIDSIEIAKKYTEKGYNLSSMSADLDVPKYQLNHYFKEYSIESFSEWKNRNRILLAVDLINNGYLNTFKLETLSLECGFKSRGNFNSAFFEVTGKKVSEYIKTC